MRSATAIDCEAELALLRGSVVVDVDVDPSDVETASATAASCDGVSTATWSENSPPVEQPTTQEMPKIIAKRER